MKQIIYAMQFAGHAAPAANSTTVLRAKTRATSCILTTSVGPAGLSGTLQPATGADAFFESEVMITGETSFVESGSIRFGDTDNELRFSTVGEGYLGGSADPKLKHGSVMWRVDGGKGQFAEATGLITSNFTIGEGGEVVDNHFGMIFTK
ncbi:MAG: hypothetical protein ACLQBA_16730 [Candidatus Binataceae bacterium]